MNRRTVLRAGAALGAAALAGCDGVTNALDGGGVSGWPTYQRGPRNTGATDAPGPGAEMDARWTVEASEVAADVEVEAVQPHLSPPVVADGVCYATLTVRNFRSGFGVHLLAVDLADGSVRWRTPVTDEFVPSGSGAGLIRPTVADGTVYVAIHGFGPPVSLVAVDARSGEVEWTRSRDGVTTTSGAVRDGRVVFGDSTAYAYEADGSLAWERAEGERPPTVRQRAPPAITDDGPVLPGYQGVIALDDEGKVRWERSLTGEGERADAELPPYAPVVGESVYVAAGEPTPGIGGRLFALDSAEGEEQWSFAPDPAIERRQDRILERREAGKPTPDPEPVGLFASPALGDGTLYAVGTAVKDGDLEDPPFVEPRLYAVDAATGEPEWSTTLPDWFTETPPVLAGDRLYVATGGGVAVLDPADGSVLEAAESTDTLVTGLAVAGDTLVAGGRRVITAFEPA